MSEQPLPHSDVISVERRGRVAVVWLDRPEKLNAMAPAFWEDLPRIMDALGADADVRAVVVAAHGKAFTVGIDLEAFGPELAAGALSGDSSSEVTDRRRLYDMITRMQHTFTAVAECPKPVIVAVHGYCIGGGVDLITACDIRLASADAVFSVRETKLAMVADVGTLQRLPTIVEPGRVAEIVYTGRDFGADEALEMGLVSQVHPDRDAVVKHALDLADQIAANSPLAVQGAKAVLGRRRARVGEELDYVALWNAAFLESNDLAEAVRAFTEQRPAEFRGD